MPSPLVDLHDVSKSFAGVAAIKSISLTIDAGEIVGLVGENGAGKSTLIKLLSGIHHPDTGSIFIAGSKVQWDTPKDAISRGVATIHQELDGFSQLSLAENIMIAETWPRRGWGGVDWSALHTEARRRLADFGLSLDTELTFSELTAAQRQEVAIASALARRARLLILDEPTASLTEPEIQRLFNHLQRLRKQGVTILYVSHRLDEIFQLTDRVVVLRDGALVQSYRTSQVEPARLVQDMVGRPLEQVYPRTRAACFGEPLLELTGASRRGMFQSVSFSVRAGEIVGLAGLVGAGRSELARAIYGLYPLDGGSMRLCGQNWRPRHPRQAIRHGLVYVPEERKRQGLVLSHSLTESISAGMPDILIKFGMISRAIEERYVTNAVEQFDVRATDPQAAIATLSGGNQQKTLLARWLQRDPQVIVLDEPTRGVDVGAKAQIHALIDRLAARGKAILLISSDLDEILGMSDRILVMNRGSLETQLQGNEMTIHNVVLAASGLYSAASQKNSERDPG